MIWSQGAMPGTGSVGAAVRARLAAREATLNSIAPALIYEEEDLVKRLEELVEREQPDDARDHTTRSERGNGDEQSADHSCRLPSASAAPSDAFMGKTSN